MRERSSPRSAGRRTGQGSYSIDCVLLSVADGRLSVLLQRHAAGQTRERLGLPYELYSGDGAMGQVADRIAREQLGRSPSWLSQLGAFGDGRRHRSGARVSVAYVGVTAGPLVADEEASVWMALHDAPSLAPRQGAMLERAAEYLRESMDRDPIAFRLLPAEFTLGELQAMYELLLGRKLHKASFRRALQAAWLVEPTDEWRTEGRGRPAQLYRYAPRKRRGVRRSVRFDLLG